MSELPSLLPGSGLELGSIVDPGGINFALFSAHAERVELCLVDDLGHETARLDLPERSGDVWHGYLPGAKSGTGYNYRVHGPSGPGHCFDPSTPLLDPYARQWSHGLAQANRPHCIVCEPPQPIDHQRPGHSWSDTLIYEAHVKGLTRQYKAINAQIAGTYSALSEPALIEHLRKIGITAIELLPIQAFADEPFLQAKGLSNYWGYNPIGFFVPEQRYAFGPDPLSEFQAAVAALHAGGIEVILDVVYNHTGEGDHTGRTLSFRGIDNASYYKLDEAGSYLNDTGCGNMLDLGQPAVIRLMMDSLRYWVDVAGVDGFRFDLATVMGRDGREFDAGGALLDCLHQDPVLGAVKLIAEPWDIGPGGYQLGGFRHPFAEWNDRFRDTIRRFWCQGDPVLPDLAMAMLGSAPIFDHGGRRSWTSVNFITSHDGFTGHDLTAFTAKHNQANLEQNRDGHGHNFSSNHGVEGVSNDPVIQLERVQTLKNLLTMMFVSQGTPMLLAGDEFGNSQGGNNNAYCQDNAIGWLDWSAEEHDLTEFVAALARLRREWPLLRQDRFLHGEAIDGTTTRNAVWRRPDTLEMTEADWHDETNLAIRLDLSDTKARLAILLNGNRSAQLFHVEAFDLLLDTGRVQMLADNLIVSPHSLAVVKF